MKVSMVSAACGRIERSSNSHFWQQNYNPTLVMAAIISIFAKRVDDAERVVFAKRET